MRLASASPRLRALSLARSICSRNSRARLASVLPLAQQAVRLLLAASPGAWRFSLQLGQDVLEPDALAAHLLLGGGDDLLRQPQPPGDGKGVGLAGNADQQPVGGRAASPRRTRRRRSPPLRWSWRRSSAPHSGWWRPPWPPAAARAVMTAMARAAPSTGSVPAPSSSKSTRLCRSASFKISHDVGHVRQRRWRGSARCSARRRCPPAPAHRRTRRCRSAAGMWRPHWVISVSRPRVLRVTVLPPVLGPVMTKVSKASAQLDVDGHRRLAGPAGGGGPCAAG